MNEFETQITKVTDLEGPLVGGEACLVCIYGPDLGKKWTLDVDVLTAGRGPQNDIVLDLDNVSRRHAEFTVLEGQVRVQDLGSTNGTYLNGHEVAASTILQNGDHVKIGAAIFKFLIGGDIETLYHEEIYRMTIVDGLTQIHNKRYFLETLEREIARCARFGRPLHLVMFDIDFFKRLNDEHGHLAGDYVLRELAAVISRTVRKEEVFARYGGEEFALIIPEAESDKVEIYAEKVRTTVEAYAFEFDGHLLPVTISLGVAAMPEGGCDASDFIRLADERLYAAKHAGRNRVVAGP